MKRQVSICIFLSVFLIFVTGIYIFFHNETKQNEIEIEDTNTQIEIVTEENTQSVTSSNEYKTYYFYAKDVDGYLFIYDVKSNTLYMETGIESSTLPEDIQAKLITGIYFENEEQLFSFLESYSS